MPSTWEYMIYVTPKTAVRGRKHFYKETEGQTCKTDMEKFILIRVDRKPYGRDIFLGLHVLPLYPFFSRFLVLPLALGLCVLIPFYALSLWATSSMSTTSTFWWTQNLTLTQIFLLSTRPLILISYWAFPHWAIPKIPHSTSLKSIHYLSQQACFNSYIYSTINCITVHSSFHLANVRVLQCAQWGYR